MGFLGTAQGRVIAFLGLLVVILLVVVAYLAGRGFAITTPSGTAAVTHATPTPSAPPSPTPTAPAVAPTAAPLSSSGTLLQAGKGSDTGAGRGNGPGCSIWVDPGWTLGLCSIVPVNGSSPEASPAYVTEHKPGATGVQWRVFIMTTGAGEAYWHTKLYASDDSGGGFVNITVRAVDVTGSGTPWLIVGFRHNRTSGGGTVLDYDVVTRGGPGSDPAVVLHRQLGDGVAVLAGQHIEDYDKGSAGYSKTVIKFVAGAFTITGSSDVAASAVPSGDLP